MARTDAHARSWLDARLQEFRELAAEPRPHKGWIRAIRDALGMSAAELGNRLSITQQTVGDLERSEQRHSIRLDTLTRAADALDCDLVYALVPRTSLNDAVRDQARRQAARHLAGVAHHSRLEGQAVTDAETDVQVAELAARLVDRRGLWTDLDTP